MGRFLLICLLPVPWDHVKHVLCFHEQSVAHVEEALTWAQPYLPTNLVPWFSSYISDKSSNLPEPLFAHLWAWVSIPGVQILHMCESLIWIHSAWSTVFNNNDYYYHLWNGNNIEQINYVCFLVMLLPPFPLLSGI